MSDAGNLGKSRQPARARDAGFTLLEVLVALVLTAMLTAGLATAIQTARRVLSATERNASASDVLAAQGFLRASISEAFVAPTTVGSMDDISFVGTPARLAFATGYVPKGLHQGLYRLELALAPSALGEGLWDLVAREQPSRSPVATGTALPAAAHVSPLIQGIAAAKFAYFGKTDRDSEEEAWFDAWPQPDRTPRLVRLDISFPQGDPRLWPTLLMPLEQAAP